MFENPTKGELHKKYNRIKGMGQPKSFSFGKDKEFEGSSVYGELKLSSNLISEINKIRQQVDSLNEQLENVKYQRDTLKANYDQLDKK